MNCVALGAERRHQLLQLGDQLVVAQDERHLDRRRIRVVRRLRHVQVVVRLDDLVLALLAPGQLERDVGHHLVGVHVGGGAGAALVPVHLELVVVLPLHHARRAAFSIAASTSWLHRADVGVGPRRRELHDRPRLDEARVVADRDARDLEVLERACRLHAVIGVRRDRLLAEQVALHARRATRLRRPRGLGSGRGRRRCRGSGARRRTGPGHRGERGNHDRDAAPAAGTRSSHGTPRGTWKRYCRLCTSVADCQSGHKKPETARSPSGTRRFNSGVPWGARRVGVKGLES